MSELATIPVIVHITTIQRKHWCLTYLTNHPYIAAQGGCEEEAMRGLERAVACWVNTMAGIFPTTQIINRV